MPYLGNVPAEAYTNTVKDSFNGDASTTAFTLSQPSTANNLRVVVENVIQDPTVAYTVSGTTLTFTSAPPVGTANIYAVHLGPATMTAVPPDEINEATTYTSDLTVQGAFTSQGIDDNADATAITIDSSENVYIGTTTDFPGASNTAEGTQIRNDGRSLFSNSSDWVVNINRNTSDGNIALFRKSGTTIGDIGTYASSLYIGTPDRSNIVFGTNAIVPANNTGGNRDNAIDLGESGVRYKDLYLGGSVYLGGTTSSNALDDYEEGTWTPTIRGAGTAGTYTYEENQGHYVKIGNQVTAWINITNVTQSSAGSSTMRLEGLPFTCNWQSGFNGVGVGVLSVDGWSGIDGDYMVPTIGDNQSYITFYYMNGTNNDLTSLAITNLTQSGTADIRGFVTYYTGG